MTIKHGTTPHSWVTPRLEDLFQAEWSNERNGGVSPATIASAIDSIAQAPEIMCPDWEPSDYVALLALAAYKGLDTQLRDLV